MARAYDKEDNQIKEAFGKDMKEAFDRLQEKLTEEDQVSRIEVKKLTIEERVARLEEQVSLLRFNNTRLR